MSNPTYQYGDTVYLRESAAVGSLEAVRIGGVHQGPNGWMYSLNYTSGAGLFDRRSAVATQTLFFSEDELLTFCDALVLVERNARAAYDRAVAMRQLHCPDNPTED